MDIKSIQVNNIVNDYGGRVVDMHGPDFVYGTQNFGQYIVQPHEEGRIDLVIDSIYGDYDGKSYEDIDVLLYLNNIDNPLSILSGMAIVYPSKDDIDDYRYSKSDEITEIRPSKASRFNKTSNSDPNRSYPPTSNPTPKPPVTVENGKIIIGGIS
jgi:hypothetical protein